MNVESSHQQQWWEKIDSDKHDSTLSHACVQCVNRWTSSQRNPSRRLRTHPNSMVLDGNFASMRWVRRTAIHQLRETLIKDSQDWYQWYHGAKGTSALAQPYQYKKEKGMAACPEETQHPKGLGGIQ